MHNESYADHIREVEAELRALTNRDLQLWGMAALVMVVLALGIVCLTQASEHGRDLLPARFTYLPQLASGLVALVVLLNLYVLGQRRALNHTTTLLLSEVARNSRITRLSFVDPATELMKREFLPELLDAEIARRNAAGSELTLLALRADHSSPGSESPEFAGAISRLLRSNFRGSDHIVRYSEFEYLVIMPDTSPAQAVPAVQRLAGRVDRWNLTSGSEAEMLLFYAVQACSSGEGMKDIKQAFQKTGAGSTTLAGEKVSLSCAVS